jgi:putative flippase GtrA
MRLRRFLRFNAVGFLGIFVQLAALAALKSGLGMNYLWATALAVETALLHNFLWHQRWTWKERAGGVGTREILERLVRFQLGNGLVSLVSNLVFMRWLVGGLQVPYLVANLFAIAASGVGNFLIGELMVFLPARKS